MSNIAKSTQIEGLTGYNLSRNFWDFSFENPEKIKPAHGAIYFFMIEICNRGGWKSKFGFPTYHAMEATGIKSKNTYYNAFKDLINMGFVTMIQKAKNSNTANIISLVTASNFNAVDSSVTKSVLDLANIQLISRQDDSTVPINKQLTNKQVNHTLESVFTPPSLDDIYIEMQFKGLDKTRAEGESKNFFDHYESNGWMVGDVKMKKWENSVSRWISRIQNFKSQNTPITNGKSNSEIKPKVNGTTQSEAEANLRGF